MKAGLFVCGALAAAILSGGAALSSTQAATIIDGWSEVKLPPAPAPALKPGTVDPKTTALLMLDFMNQNCGKRPTCVANIPSMKKLLSEARAADATVVYSIIARSTTADIIKDLAPTGSEPYVQAGPNKFVNTDLAKILKDKGITTVIVTGTESNGAVLFTAAGAAFRGMNVIVPVDGMSSSDPFADLATAFTIINAPSLSTKSTLTRTDMIKF